MAFSWREPWHALPQQGPARQFVLHDVSCRCDGADTGALGASKRGEGVIRTPEQDHALARVLARHELTLADWDAEMERLHRGYSQFNQSYIDNLIEQWTLQLIERSHMADVP